jgi:Secretion system C-terminal sorting domain
MLPIQQVVTKNILFIMKLFLILFWLCVVVQLSAQTSSYIIVPTSFSISTKQWVLQQFKNAANGQVVLYKESFNVCGNNYGCAVSGPLPVTGMELSGFRLNKDKAKLNWKTFTEINNRGFDVERTFDINGIFLAVNFVQGSGNSFNEKNYELIDENKYDGITYYRLKQINIDGSYMYSNIVAVKGYTNTIGIKPFPNPSKATNINFEIEGLKVGSKMSIIIYDQVGKSVYQNKNMLLTSTYIITCKDLSHLASGVYHIYLFSDEKLTSASFIITE